MQIEYRSRSDYPYWIPYYDTTVQQDQILQQLAGTIPYARYQIEPGRTTDDRSGYRKIEHIKMNETLARKWLVTVFPYHCAWITPGRGDLVDRQMQLCNINRKSYAISIYDHSTAAWPKPYSEMTGIRCVICDTAENQVLFKLTTSEINWLA